MRSVVLIIGVFALLNVFSQAKIEALEIVYDFDTVANGGAVVHNFKFVNIGNKPLVISRANTTCGCDVTSWSREPISPGDTTIINYKYDSKRVGPIKKSFTITSNAINYPRLTVRTKGYVLPRKTY